MENDATALLLKDGMRMYDEGVSAEQLFKPVSTFRTIAASYIDAIAGQDPIKRRMLEIEIEGMIGEGVEPQNENCE